MLNGRSIFYTYIDNILYFVGNKKEILHGFDTETELYISFVYIVIHRSSAISRMCAVSFTWPRLSVIAPEIGRPRFILIFCRSHISLSLSFSEAQWKKTAAVWFWWIARASFACELFARIGFYICPPRRRLIHWNIFFSILIFMQGVSNMTLILITDTCLRCIKM